VKHSLRRLGIDAGRNGSLPRRCHQSGDRLGFDVAEAEKIGASSSNLSSPFGDSMHIYSLVDSASMPLATCERQLHGVPMWDTPPWEHGVILTGAAPLGTSVTHNGNAKERSWND